ncbi:hypothetical protein Y032_0077g1123 [Ancylostoma ceylanicum]|uniref:Uncharacterized protein n=1 Tax=Ancylostoma ceylanicum TaxID=53326 RepID=A0A016TTC0_9BILA|nr:hypothetical protein Y032_0077g1123 [Ancylostoma ceylanicum]
MKACRGCARWGCGQPHFYHSKPPNWSAVSDCVTRRSLLSCDWSIHVRVAAAVFKHTSSAGENWTSFLS